MKKTLILLSIDDFCIYLKKIIKKIKLILLLHRHNRHGVGNINLEIDDDSINYININYIDKNNEDIEKNKNDISTNLINISSNEDKIASNLSEIKYLKKNKSTQYLKNINNILFYDKKTQINFKGIFYEKVFELNANKNDFIEMKFKIDLQYEDISERNYVKTIYEIFNENNNSLYIKSITNNDYVYFSNRVIVDEDIFIILIRMLKK